MSILRCLILTAILLLPFLSKSQQQDGSILERRVSISAKNQPLQNILQQISWQADVFFSYDATIVDSDKTFNIEAADKSLYTVLKQLFETEKYNLKELENQIIITQKTAAKSIEQKEKFFFLSGTLIDQKKGKPISYASVSVLNKPIGTISNSDGEFLLKIHPSTINDSIIISCMGYKQIILSAHKLLDEDLFFMEPISIRIREVKVKAVTPEELLRDMRRNIKHNYSLSSRMLTTFYRETVKQDDAFINVSEAVMELLKAPYAGTFRNDLVRIIKGRKSPDVQPFRWLNFKLQGGPFTITKMDVVKNMENFINELSEEAYRYEIKRVIWYHKQPVYVIGFSPRSEKYFPGFEGEIFIHKESSAIVHANFKFNKHSLKQAQHIMIRKKPRGVTARPVYVRYQVNYQNYQGKWHLSTSQASVKFKVKSKRDKLNSEFHSVSDLLVTNIEPTDVKRFTTNERFTRRDVFVEKLGQFDEQFWENYNIIKPDEDLRNAFKETAVSEK